MSISSDFVVDCEALRIRLAPKPSGKVWGYDELYTWLTELFGTPAYHAYDMPLFLSWKGPIVLRGWDIDADAQEHLKLWELEPLKHSDVGPWGAFSFLEKEPDLYEDDVPST